MFYDDRLATVLRQTGESKTGARTQFRQLLDILGNRKFSRDDSIAQSQVAAAWLRMDALAEIVPASERAAAIRERGWRLRNADLTAHLADFEPEVASAALNRADLSEDDWSALIPRLPVRARGFLRLRDDLPVDVEALLDRLGVHDRGLPQPEQAVDAHEAEDAPAEETQSAPPFSVDDMAAPPTTFPARNRPAVFDLSPANEPFELSEEAPSEDIDPAEQIEASGSAPFVGPEEADTGRNEISALVERIAQFKREREVARNLENAPLLPLEDEDRPQSRALQVFGFSVDASGRIEWAEAAAAPMVIGKRLVPAQAFADPATQSLIERAFDRRQPIHQAPFALQGAAAIAGDWLVDAQPRFSDEGSFKGYVGRFRRTAHGDAQAESRRIEADRIRQLLHELRTPVTAVQGYAEVIQQQLFGPAPHEYRALAAAIAADAARILAGFEELDRLARLETDALEMIEGEADLSDIAARITGQIAGVLSPRMAGVELLQDDDKPVQIALDQEDAEALIWRILATLGGACGSGEIITCRLVGEHSRARLLCELPEQLAGQDDLFAANVKPANVAVNAGLFGAGFTLRLARAEARAAGGMLSHEDEYLLLTLPLLTEESALPSQAEDASDEDPAPFQDDEPVDHRAGGEA